MVPCEYFESVRYAGRFQFVNFTGIAYSGIFISHNMAPGRLDESLCQNYNFMVNVLNSMKLQEIL